MVSLLLSLLTRHRIQEWHTWCTEHRSGEPTVWTKRRGSKSRFFLSLLRNIHISIPFFISLRFTCYRTSPYRPLFRSSTARKEQRYHRCSSQCPKMRKIRWWSISTREWACLAGATSAGVYYWHGTRRWVSYVSLGYATDRSFFGVRLPAYWDSRHWVHCPRNVGSEDCVSYKVLHLDKDGREFPKHII